ncbi:MAG: L-lactate permease [Idiomarina sp.]|nr:L-lactate permease [Idiomarina sp.]
MIQDTFSSTTFLLLTLPFLVILIAMVGLRWSAFKAGSIALLLCLVILPWHFSIGWQPTVTSLIPGTIFEAMGTTFSIIWIILAALCIYYAQHQSGALEVIQRYLAKLHPDPRVSALLIAWFFSLFMEGAAGFGTSAALTAPFLVAAGYRPVIAVVLALWGHSLGVAYGAVGTPIMAQSALLQVPDLILSHATLPYLGLPALVLSIALMAAIQRFYGDNRQDGTQTDQVRVKSLSKLQVLSTGALAGLSFVLPAMLIAYALGPELPTLLGAIVGAVIFVALVPRLIAKQASLIPSVNQPEMSQKMTIWRALAPYIVLVFLVLLTRLIPSLKTWLLGYTLNVTWHIYEFSIAPLYHPGTLLWLGFLFGGFIQRQPVTAWGQAVRLATLRISAVVPALLVMLWLSRLLVHSGAIAELGAQIVLLTGIGWAFWAVFVGVLGTFITGSATSSNILFTEFQHQAATHAQVPAIPLIGAQNFGAAIGNMVCPHNIIAAGATVNIQGQEGQVMRYTLPMALLLSAVTGISAWLLVT